MNDSKEIASVQRQSVLAAAHMGALGGFANQVIAGRARHRRRHPSTARSGKVEDRGSATSRTTASIHLEDRDDKIRPMHGQAIQTLACVSSGSRAIDAPCRSLGHDPRRFNWRCGFAFHRKGRVRRQAGPKQLKTRHAVLSFATASPSATRRGAAEKVSGPPVSKSTTSAALIYSRRGARLARIHRAGDTAARSTGSWKRLTAARARTSFEAASRIFAIARRCLL